MPRQRIAAARPSGDCRDWSRLRGAHRRRARRGDRLRQPPDLLADAIAHGCQGIISFGIAGGLASHMRPGTCIVARSVIARRRPFQFPSRMVATAPAGDPRGRAWRYRRRHGADRNASRQACRRRPDGGRGGRHGIASLRARRHQAWPAVCGRPRSGRPFASVACRRRRSEPCARTAPPDLSAVLRSIVARPTQIGALIRTALDAHTARSALVRARRLLGPGLSVIEVAGRVMAPVEQI